MTRARATRVFAAGSNRAAVLRRMLDDVSDAIQLGRREPTLGAGALAFAAVGTVARLQVR